MAQILMVAGTALQAVGAIRQGNYANEAAKYNAAVQEQAAATVNAQATGRQELQRAKARETIGAQLAATSESGTSLSGSNLDLLSESLYNAELDALNIRYEADLNAKGLMDQAKLTRAEGKNARTAGYISAAAAIAKGSSSYLNGGGQLNYSYNNDANGMQYSRTGEQIRGRR